MIYGYARVSSRDQSLARQLDALDAFGCDRVYADKASGRDFERPEWSDLMASLSPGDVVAVKSIDRLGRDYDGILAAWRDITAVKGADIVVLDMPLLDTRGGVGGLAGKLISDIVLQLLSYVAQQEREFIHRRQAEGIAAAKARGVRFGRPPKERPACYPDVKARHLDGKATKRESAARLGVSVTTFDKWLAEDDLAERLRVQPSLF